MFGYLLCVVTCKECSGRWRDGEVARGAADGVLSVLLIVIVTVLIAIISVVVCVRRKNVKFGLDAKPNSTSHEPPAFTSECSRYHVHSNTCSEFSLIYDN